MQVKPYKWWDLPRVSSADGTVERAGFRQDNALLVFNWFDPSMKRLEPRRLSYDQIILTFDGTQILEVDGKAYACPARSITRIPANALHSRWTSGKEPVFGIDVVSLQSDLISLADWQPGFPPRAARTSANDPPIKTASEEFKGEWLADTTGIVYRWDKLQTEPKYDGGMQRTGFRGDNSLVTFNWIDPAIIKPQPLHTHTFDQLILIAEGDIVFNLNGEKMDIGPRSILHAPGVVPHTGGPVAGGKVLNIDVFSPVRADYAYLANYQTDVPKFAKPS